MVGLQSILKNSKSRFGDYIAVLCILIKILLIIVHGIECVITKVKYIVELKDRVLAPWGPLSISAVAELVPFPSVPVVLKTHSLTRDVRSLRWSVMVK